MNGATVKVYSRAKDGNTKLSANFKVNEFACNDGSNPVFISPELVRILQEIRDYFKAPITINSGFRTATKNKAVGGSPNSQHLYGMAADITVKGVEPKKVYAYADSLMPYTGGVGLYKTFTHVDCRRVKSRWQG